MQGSEKIDLLPGLEEQSPEEFEWAVSDYFKDVQSARQRAIEERHPNPSAAAKEFVYKKHVEGAEFKELGKLCEILFLAPLAADIQERLDPINDELSNLNNRYRDRESRPPEVQLRIAELKKLKKPLLDSMMPFNHLLRDFVIDNGDHISHENLENWLSKANNNVPGPFKKILSGFAVEAACNRFVMQGLAGEDIACRKSTIEEDKAGIDMVIIYQGREINVDVKTGGNIADGLGKVSELDIERNEVSGFDISPNARIAIARRIRNMLT